MPECNHSQPIDSTNNAFAYNDTFARIKCNYMLNKICYEDKWLKNSVLPMAAAAYGEDEAIGQCLTRTYSAAKVFCWNKIVFFYILTNHK